MAQLIRRGSISGFDSQVGLPTVAHDQGRYAGFRDLMWEAFGRRVTMKGYRELLEEKIAAQLSNEREVQRINRFEMREDQSWYHGEQDRDDLLAQEVPELRGLTVNIIRPAVDYAIGMGKGLRLEGAVVPTGGTSYTDEELNKVAQEFDARLKVAQNIGGFTQAKNHAIHSAATAGVGYWETVLKHHPASGSNHIMFRPLEWRNVYKDSSCRGTRQARYLYHLQRVDLNRMYDRFPKSRMELHDFSVEYTTRVSVDDSYELEEYPHHTLYSDAGTYRTGRTDSGDHIRPMVVYGTGWYRDTVFDRNGHPQDVVLKVLFITDEGFERVKLLKDPVWIYGHNEIPVTELAYSYRDNDLQPYTPLIRNRRGLQKAVRILLRHTITHLRSRGALVRYDKLPNNVDPAEYTEDVLLRIGMPLFVLGIFDEGAVEIIENDRRVDQLSDMLMKLIDLSNDHSGVHPALLGKATNVEAAVAMQKVADDAMRSQSGFLENLTYAVRESSEIALSLIEQFAGMIDYPARRERGQLVQMGSDGDQTIMGNRAMYQITPITREETLSKAHQMMFGEVAKVNPQVAAQLATLMLQNSRIDDSGDTVRDLVDTMRNMGMAVPPSMLTQQERQAQVEAQQAQQQMQQAAQQAEIQKVQSEAQKNQASAMKDQADAQAPSQSEKESELRQTVERQARELQQLRGG